MWAVVDIFTRKVHIPASTHSDKMAQYIMNTTRPSLEPCAHDMDAANAGIIERSRLGTNA